MVDDWRDKVHRAIERVTEQYDSIGKMTGIPVLGIIISPEMEENAINEWKIQSNTIEGYRFEEINVLKVTIDEVSNLGVDHVVNMIENPMPGASPESELGNIWIKEIINKDKQGIINTI